MSGRGIGRINQSERPKRRDHLHLPGVVHIALTFFLAIGAFNSQNNLLFAAFGIALSGLIISGFVGGGALMGVRIKREAVGIARAGEPIRISYVIENTNRFLPAFALLITEQMDHSMGFDHPLVAFVPQLGPGQRIIVSAGAIPTARGCIDLSSVRVSSTFPLGISRKSLTFVQRASFLIRPVKLTLTESARQPVRSCSETGLSVVHTRGRAEEFYGLREYRQGDPQRQIAWKPSARTGRLVVTEHAKPMPRAIMFVVDLPESATQSEQELAAGLLGAAITEAFRLEAAVGLALGSRVICSPAYSSEDARRMMETLAVMPMIPGSDQNEQGLSLKISPGTAVIRIGLVRSPSGQSAMLELPVSDAENLVEAGSLMRFHQLCNVYTSMQGGRSGGNMLRSMSRAFFGADRYQLQRSSGGGDEP